MTRRIGSQTLRTYSMINDGQETAAGGWKPEKKDLDWLNYYLNYCESSSAESDFRDAFEENYDFYSGRQDSQEVLDALADQNRPATVFNEIKPKIDMLDGLAGQAKYSVQVVPMNTEDQALSELMNGVLHHFRRQLKLYRKETDAFHHGIRGGRSGLHFWVDTRNPFSPQIVCTTYRGDQYYVDPDSTEYDLSDARFLFLNKWLLKEEIKAFWPDFDPEQVANSASQSSNDKPVYFDEVNDKYRIVEAWFTSVEKGIWFMNPLTGVSEWLHKDDFKKLQDVLAEGIQMQDGQFAQFPEIEHVEGYNKLYRQAIFCDMQILSSQESPYVFDGFPFAQFGAYKDDVNNLWVSVVASMKDPQMAFNTMKRQLVHLLQTLPKGILMHETGSVVNIEEYEERSSEPNFHLEIQPNALARNAVQFKDQPQISPLYQFLGAEFQQSMKDVSGIHGPLLGEQGTSREPGVTLQLKQETGLAGLYTLFSNFADFRMNAARIMIHLIQQFVSDKQVIRILGPKGWELLTINSQMNPQAEGFNDISALEFDLEVDESIESATLRSVAAQYLTEYARNNPGMVPPDIQAEYSGLPVSIQMRLREHWQNMMKAEKEQQDREFELKKLELGVKAADVKAKHSAKQTEKE